MSASQQETPNANQRTQHIVTPIREYKDYQILKGEKSGLEQQISLMKQHQRELGEKDRQNTKLREENAVLSAQIDSNKQRFKLNRILAIVSTILVGTGCSVPASDISNSSLSLTGGLLILAGLAVYACMFLTSSD